MMALINSQRGATLIVCLIILAVLTLIGVASMQRSGLELKMISSAHDRSVAFEAAETALNHIEKELNKTPPDVLKFYNSCTGAGCFTPTCDKGLCFSGEFTPDTDRAHCYINNPALNNEKDVWEDTALNIWNDKNKHQTLTIDGINRPVKYIIEFLCFTNIGTELGTGFNSNIGSSNNSSENENYKPLFRITAMAKGNADRATVILQSTYRVIKDT